LRRALVVLVALALGALMLEGIVRIVWRDEVDTRTLREAVEARRIGALKRYAGDPVLYYELEPSLDTTFGGARVVTSPDGRRVAEDARGPPPADAVRLAVLGDSTCFGWKVPFEASYPERVRARLERAWERPVALGNFCVPGYNAIQDERVLTSRVLPWDPDLIVWHYDHNDVLEPLAEEAPIGMPPTHGDNVLGSALVKLVLRRVREARTRPLALDRDAHGVWNHYVTSGPLFDRHLEALARAGRACARAGVPVVLLLFDTATTDTPDGDEHERRLHEPLREALAAAGFDVVDMLPARRARMRAEGRTELPELWLSPEPPLDVHPNAEGHGFIADVLAPALLERWPRPPDA